MEMERERRCDLMSIIQLLPLQLESSTLSWPPSIVEALKAPSKGPHGWKDWFSISPHPLSPSAAQGYSLFFDDLISRDQSMKWSSEVVPALSNLLLRLPSLLESHYHHYSHPTINTRLRFLESQHPGFVLLTQELIAALIACSFFCLFPVTNRGAKHLPLINFDHMFASLYDSYSEKQENKIRCLVHYFERICSTMPVGFVSFERKVLPLECGPLDISYPKADFWSQSSISLCHFEVQRTGFMEDQTLEALEVDFANKYIGGGALNKGCVQEEIRFMINPELIVGMLFLPSMSDNEAIEIVGTERFSNYTGYASSFRFAGDHVDRKDVDVLGRRKTRIIAIDALCSPGLRQYGLECLLREINKAFCGFLDQTKYKSCKRQSQDDMLEGAQLGRDVESLNKHGAPSTSGQTDYGASGDQLVRDFHEKVGKCLDHEVGIGIVTGNWGCGAFGGDPELKTIIQWLAASQALRPFISYHTFGVEALQKLDQVIEWIGQHKWTVGELWDMLMEYSTQRVKGQTNLGFLTWLLPSLSSLPDDPMLLDDCF